MLLGVRIKRLLGENSWFFGLFLLWVLVGAGLLVYPGSTSVFLWVNHHRSALLDYSMTFFTALGQAEYISIVLLSLFFLPAFRTRAYLLLALITGIGVTLFSQGLKIYFNAPRPLNVLGPTVVHTVPWLDNNFHHSFPSGHTLGAFAFFSFYSFFLSPKYKSFGALFFILAALCGISRMYLGQHFFADVYAGSIFGVLFMTLLYALALPIFFHKTKPLI